MAHGTSMNTEWLRYGTMRQQIRIATNVFTINERYERIEENPTPLIQIASDRAATV